MYPNPKTKKGQILYQIFNAVIIGAAILYPLFIVFAPLAPKITSSGGFLDFPPLLESLLVLILTFPLFISFMGITFCIKRLICIKTNDPQTNKMQKIANILYFIILSASVIALVLYIFYAIGKSSLFGIVIVLSIISITLLIALFCMHKSALKKDGVIAVIPPAFEVNIYKKPLFIISVIVLILALLSLPTSHERASFEYDPNGYIYDRTNSFLYSYIKAENRETHQTADLKFVIFPFNYKETSELFGFK